MHEKKLTPEKRQAILDWYAKRQELGTQAQLAQRLGLSLGYVERVLWLWSDRPAKGDSSHARVRRSGDRSKPMESQG